MVQFNYSYSKYRRFCSAVKSKWRLRAAFKVGFSVSVARQRLWSSTSAPRGLNKSLITYLLTPWCRVLLEQPTGLQLVKKFPTFHRTRRFITALTSVHHLSLSWASPIQSIYPQPTSWRSILILSTHLSLGLASGLFPSVFPTKTLYTPLSSPIHATCPAHLNLLNFITRTILGEQCEYLMSCKIYYETFSTPQTQISSTS